VLGRSEEKGGEGRRGVERRWEMDGWKLTEPVAGCCEGGLFCSGAERAGDGFVSGYTLMKVDGWMLRRRTYKLSPMTTQAKGPQVMAKEAMNMQAATIMTIPELSYSVGGRAMATEAKISSHADCQRAP
jgi:hypothetical protein